MVRCIQNEKGEKMSRLIILDSNIIYRVDLDNMSQKIKKIESRLEGDVYISRVVLDELTEFYLRKYETEVFDNLKDHVIYTELYDTKQPKKIMIERAKEIVEKHLKEIFNDRIIEIEGCDTEYIYNRAIKKIPPFNSVKGKSDQGYKDTLIWLSILNKEYYEEDIVILLSKDNGFFNNKRMLENEFKEKNNKEISIINNIEENKEVKEITPHVKNIEHNYETKNKNIVLDFIEIEKYREIILEALSNVAYYIKNNGPYDPPETTRRFYMYEILKLKSLTNFNLSLKELINKNILNAYVKPLDFIFNLVRNELEIKSFEDIPTQSIVKLYDISLQFENEFPMYSNHFLEVITDYLNENNYIDQELPF